MPSMGIGGAERSLLGILDTFDYSEVEVSLFLYRHEGEFLKYIPEKVKILKPIKRYNSFDVPIASLIFSRNFLCGIMRIVSKLAQKVHCIITKEKSGVWMSMQYISKYLQPLLPKIPGEYDLGIMFLGIPDTLINKVRANKKVTWNHTDYDQLYPSARRDIKLYNKVDKIVSVSEECNKKVIARYPHLKNKAIVIENIISKNLIMQQSEEDVKDFNVDKGQVSLLSIGRFSHAKNFDNVPRICKSIIEKGVNIKWFIIGYGGDENLIKEKIKESQVENNVIILGKKTNPYPYIKRCNIYVQPSRYEGKCVAVREAQILGKPVIITNYDTANSQLDNGVDGFIVPMENECCATGIINVINNTLLIKKISENLLQRNYTNEDEIDKILNLMEE